MLIYTDRRYLPQGQCHVAMLAPFWGKNPEANDPSAGRFDRYVAVGSKYFDMVPFEEANVAILPGEWLGRDPNPNAFELAEKASCLHKRIVIFFNNDSTENIPIENSVIFRTSFYRSTRKKEILSNVVYKPELNISR